MGDPLPEGGASGGSLGGAMGGAAHSGRSGENQMRQKMASNYALEFGGGFTAPTSDSTPYISWGGNFLVGGGYNFTQRIALLAEYQFIDDKLPGAMVAETYSNGGNAHIWSLTLDPKINLFPRSANDIYITGGGGFYRKVTNFTDLNTVEYCDYYYCETGTASQVVGHFSSNQGGWNIGLGYQRHLGGMYHEGRMKLFAEARYLNVLTPEYNSSPNGLGTTFAAAGTKIIPVTFGVRW
jgi:hypothetical protein